MQHLLERFIGPCPACLISSTDVLNGTGEPSCAALNGEKDFLKYYSMCAVIGILLKLGVTIGTMNQLMDNFSRIEGTQI